MKSIRLILLLAAFCLALPSHADGFLSSLFSSNEQKYLAPDAAFKVSVDARDGRNLAANFDLAPSYYVYRNKIHFTVKDKGIEVAKVDMPPGELVHDRNMGDLMEIHQSFKANILLNRKDSAARSITLDATYQGCTEKGLCYPPINKTFKVALPAMTPLVAAQAKPFAPTLSNAPQGQVQAEESENSRIAELFKQGSFWLVVSFFFGAGLLLAFTPCMFPMIPILSGIIVGRGHKITHAHGFILSFAYVMGMAITYAAVGVLAGFSGTLLSNALQTPWALGSFALIFVLLALSMFGLYELQLPTALQSRLTSTSNKLHGGHISGVFVMGALSAIIVGPCVAAPLAGALLYIGQTHDAFLGGSALFAMALGMGVFSLLIGIAYLIGALSGARDPLRPLGALGTSIQPQAVSTLPFVRVKSLDELSGRVAQANGKPVMLDYYADWCVSCKEMERFTFSDPRVRAKLKNAVLLQADVTANNEDDKALLAHYELFGPPAILFFGPDGKELTAQRVTGYQNAEQFLASLENAGL